MRKGDIQFFSKEAYIRTSHNRFYLMGKNLYLLNSSACPDGKSFVHNVTDIIHSKATLKEKGQYIYLASLRNYLTYKMTGELTLEYALVPRVPLQVLIDNRLLMLENGKIHFYHEEN